MLSQDAKKIIERLAVSDEPKEQLILKGQLAKLVTRFPNQLTFVLDKIIETIRCIDDSRKTNAGPVALANIIHSKASVFHQLASNKLKKVMKEMSGELNGIGFPCPF